MSTLSEIAANHAMNVKTREVESGVSKPYSPVMELFEMAPQASGQMPLHAIATMSENKENLLVLATHY